MVVQIRIKIKKIINKTCACVAQISENKIKAFNTNNREKTRQTNLFRSHPGFLLVGTTGGKHQVTSGVIVDAVYRSRLRVPRTGTNEGKDMNGKELRSRYRSTRAEIHKGLIDKSDLSPKPRFVRISWE